MLREKKRYIAIQKTEKEKIEELLLSMFGEIGYSKLRVKIIDEKDYTIVRVSNKFAKEVVGAFLINKIKTIKTSGSLKALKNKINNDKPL